MKLLNTTLVTSTQAGHDKKKTTSRSAAGRVSAMSVKLPSFWPADPEVWFAKVMEVATPSVAAIHTPQPITKVIELREEVARLSEVVQTLLTQHRRRNSSRSTRSPSPAHPRPPTDPALCWYHQKFGGAAQKCTEPCTRVLSM